MKNTIKQLDGKDAVVTRQTLQGFGGVFPQAKLLAKKSAWTLIFLALIGFLFAACPGPDTETTKTWSLKYDANGATGTVPDSQTVEDGTILIIADKGDLTFLGKFFSGWNTSQEGHGTAYTPDDSITMKEDCTLYAQWSDIVYTVRYDANGGTGTVTSERTVKKGTTITVSNQGSLTYTGKSFGGWNTETDGSGTSYAAYTPLTVNGDVTLYAQWLDQYTVTYHANGGTGTVPTSRTVSKSSTITVSGQGSLTYTGKTLNNWNTAADGSGTSYAAGASLTVNSDITLYAQWISRYQYTVTYRDYDGTGTVPEPQTIGSGDNIIIASGDTLTRDNYSFNGWSTNSYGSGTLYAAGDSFTVERNTTLYAQWIPDQYTVTYRDYDGTGTVPAPQTVERGGSITIANGTTLTRNGYHFGGWNTRISGSGTTYKAGSSFTPDGDNSNITLYAFWVAPRIRTEDAYKEVTSDGVVRIHLETGDQYIFEGTTAYRLYRSTSPSSGYSVVATASSDKLVLEDTTADWMTVGNVLTSAYYYKVAAVSGGTEAMSTNGVKINRVGPEIIARYSPTSGRYGYCVVALVYNTDGAYLGWTGTTSSFQPRVSLSYEGSPIPLANYILLTGMSDDQNTWDIVGPLTIRASHTYTISVYPIGSVESSFVKSNWTFFTP